MARRGSKPNIDMTIAGIPELKADLRSLTAALQDIRAMQDIAGRAATVARSLVPVRSGLLQSTIKASRSKNKATVKAGSKRVPYAAVINYGWPRRGIAPSGFMERTDAAMKPLLPELLNEAIRRLIREGRLS